MSSLSTGERYGVLGTTPGIFKLLLLESLPPKTTFVIMDFVNDTKKMFHVKHRRIKWGK